MGAGRVSLPGADVAPAAQRGGRLWAAFAAVVAATVLLVFVLPLHVPMRPIATISMSYLAGFNNQVATVGAGLLSVLVLAWTASVWRDRAVPAAPADACRGLGWGWILPVVVLSGLLLGGWWLLVLQSHERYLGDAGYMVEQASIWRETGRALYTQIEFGYGPLLVLPAAWFGMLLHISTAAGYGIALVVESTLGLLILAYVLNVLPIRDGLRRAAFAALALGAITPHLGLNYTYFRFLSPLAVLLFATRQRRVWPCAAMLAVGLVLEMLISPELAIATLAGVLVFAAVRVLQAGWYWAFTAVLPILGAGLLILVLGSSYLALLRTFTQGGFILPLGPYPHIVLFLVAMVWLAPLGLGRRLRWRDPEAGRLLAVYLASLVLSAAALGRCDPLHVLFNGSGMLLLSLTALSWSAPLWRVGWALCLFVMTFWNYRVNEALFAYRTAYTLKVTLLPKLPSTLRTGLILLVSEGNGAVRGYLAKPEKPEARLNLPELERVTGGAPVVTPIEISPTVEAQLKATHQYSPGYYMFWVNVMSSAAEERKIAAMDQFQWMLLPNPYKTEDVELPYEEGKFQGMGWHLRQRNPNLYRPGAAFRANVATQWRPVESMGDYMLYQHDPATGP